MGVTRTAHPPGAAARAFNTVGGLLFTASLVYFAWFYFAGLARRGPGLTAPLAIAVNTVAFTLFAAHHSLFARAPFRAWIARHVSPYLERTVYVWMASLLLAATCAVWQPFGAPLWALDGLAWWLLRLIQSAGIVLSIRAASALDAMALAGVRQLDEPLPASGAEPPRTALRVDGLYGFVRHPIYFAWLLIVWPAPVMTPSHLLFAALSTLYLLIAIVFEERSLRETYKAAYVDYARRVPYKLIPWVL